MSHLPYGYVIKDGEVYIDEKKATKVKKLFDAYISGLSLQSAAAKAGLDLFHGSVGKMLRNKRYLGDEFYPCIIDTVTFNKAEEIRTERAAATGRCRSLPKSAALMPRNQDKQVALGRTKEVEKFQKPKAAASFVMPRVECKFTDPFKQAEYVYSKIKEEKDE